MDRIRLHWQDLLQVLTDNDKSQQKLLIGAGTLTIIAIKHSSLFRMISAVYRRLRIKSLTYRYSATTDNDQETATTVSQIYIYPVKSLQAVSVSAANVGNKGLEGDRNFMLVAPRPPPNYGSFGPNDASHQFMTQRQIPLLATIRAIVNNKKDGSPALILSSYLVKDSVTITLPTSTNAVGETWRARIWDDVTEVLDMGDAAASFLSQIVAQDKDAPPQLLPGNKKKSQLRLVSMKRDDRETDDRYTPRAALSWTGAAPKVSLTDGFPILIVSEASLEELNRRIQSKGKKPIEMSRFRPNIVVKGPTGKPFEEDTWRVISINGVIFHIVKGCPRCKQSCTDQATGRVSEEPLETLAEFRALGPVKDNVYFAQNAIADGLGGVIHVGAKVQVLESGDPIWDSK